MEVERQGRGFAERISFKVGGQEIAFAHRENVSPYSWLLKRPGLPDIIDCDQYSNDIIERVQLDKYPELRCFYPALA